MIFSSLLFLFWFMPVFFLIYYLVPMRAKNFVLLVGSMVFYGWGEPKYLILLVISILVNYLAGLLIHRFRGRADRIVLVCALVFDIGMLFFFKYAFSLPVCRVP